MSGLFIASREAVRPDGSRRGIASGKVERAVTESPAETIRRAAALMRDRAGAATPGPWLGVMGKFKEESWPCVIAASGDLEDPVTWLMGAGNANKDRAADAAHAGSWHPLVADAVADLLDEISRQYDAPPCDSPDGVCNGCERREDFNDAVRLARAYLGEETTAATGACDA